MRVGVYVDAFNLYYGARNLCGRSTPGWRWLDLRALAGSLVAARRDWAGAVVDRVVYCTARIDQATNPSGHVDQDVYLKALRASRCVDLIEYGYYVARVKQAPMAVKAPGPAGVPQLVRPQWPIMVQDGAGVQLPNSVFLVSYANREEKGSDVNVASHLLVDVLTSRVDAAVVIERQRPALSDPVHADSCPCWRREPVAEPSCGSASGTGRHRCRVPLVVPAHSGGPDWSSTSRPGWRVSSAAGLVVVVVRRTSGVKWVYTTRFPRWGRVFRVSLITCASTLRCIG